MIVVIQNALCFPVLNQLITTVKFSFFYRKRWQSLSSNIWRKTQTCGTAQAGSAGTLQPWHLPWSWILWCAGEW